MPTIPNKSTSRTARQPAAFIAKITKLPEKDRVRENASWTDDFVGYRAHAYTLYARDEQYNGISSAIFSAAYSVSAVGAPTLAGEVPFNGQQGSDTRATEALNDIVRVMPADVVAKVDEQVDPMKNSAFEVLRKVVDQYERDYPIDALVAFSKHIPVASNGKIAGERNKIIDRLKRHAKDKGQTPHVVFGRYVKYPSLWSRGGSSAVPSGVSRAAAIAPVENRRSSTSSAGHISTPPTHSPGNDKEKGKASTL